MSLIYRMFSLTLSAGLLAGVLMFSQTSRADTDTSGNWLPLSGVIEKLEAAGYRNIEKIEREDGRYEVRATNGQGERSKLLLDARTGEIVAKPRAYERRSRQQSERHGDQGSECNKRRCRDDMPVTPAGSR